MLLCEMERRERKRKRERERERKKGDTVKPEELNNKTVKGSEIQKMIEREREKERER